MDFIKTSSLRALIELTFQRNWNGLIWMSRKGVITKRVRLSRRLYRETAPNRAVRLAEKLCSRSAKVTSVRLKSRPKFQTDRPITQRPGKHCPAVGQAKRSTPRRARPKRASREQASRPRNLRVPRPMHPSEPGNNVPRPAEISSAKSHPSDHAGRPQHPATTVPTRPTTRLSGRSSRPTVPTPRSTRSPFHIFKPGLTLSRL
ncbi:unnamed protein product [Microthlaspi erraticum]|uniref:Uncharacterized protein n=1 Tax=Microthlaspi erraticum TaxID=1685480 RepID=A0A6D2KEA5_9BRAS|nr:unnamed protein product [Microthlaspi erraticum]